MTFLIKKSEAGMRVVFNSIKRKILEHLEKLEKQEDGTLQKAFSEMLFLEKGGKGLPVGTIREWKGKKFIKTAPGKWKPKYDNHSRGAKLAIAALKKKVVACNDAHEMMMLVLENRDRFSDKNGNPLPFVQELHDFVMQTQNESFTKTGKRKKSAAKNGHTSKSGGGDDGYGEKNYPEYKGKGQEAVDFIVKNKGGQVRGAFNRPEIGDIDVVWGEVTDKEKHTGYGLSHIIDKHGIDPVRKFGEIIEYGKVVKPVKGRASIQLGNWKIALKQQFNGNKKIWIVTAFKNEEKGTVATPSPQTDYTEGTISETSTQSIPIQNEKSKDKKSEQKISKNIKDLTIVKETEKAYCFQGRDNTAFWCPKAWFNSDGNLKEKRVFEFKYNRELALRTADFDYSKFFNVVKETEKAVQLQTELTLTYADDREVIKMFWCPKSMLKSYYFISKKVQELCTETGAGAHCFDLDLMIDFDSSKVEL